MYVTSPNKVSRFSRTTLVAPESEHAAVALGYAERKVVRPVNLKNAGPQTIRGEGGEGGGDLGEEDVPCLLYRAVGGEAVAG